ncbi:MAG TPA: phosphate ABC transporter substrate-binding protein PstS [Terriglobales bacterium]|nr:phosphate ABC transporter substrate-binding protein PstS [Terriglobales bacterium]
MSRTLRCLHLSSILSIFLSLSAMLACNSGSKSMQNAPQAGGGSANQLIGAGSTFINPIMTRWVSDFTAGHSGVQINYQSIGSGGGIQQLKQGLVDFGASDAALDDDKLKEMPALVQIPESAGPVCITYNLPDLKEPLKLSAKSLAGIFLGTIKTWQDPELRKDNPGAKLPNTAIIVSHRSDGSGTTNIFTTYLAKVSPEWQKKVGKGISVSWPVGIGGKGSEGVTGVVKQTPGGIGYVELTYAKENNLPVAQIRNQAGNWVEPSADGTTAAINAFADQLAKDVRTPIVDPPASAKDAYPIAGLTFLLVPKEPKSAEKGKLLKDFIEYIVTQGQQQAEALYYAKLPDALQQQDQTLLSQGSAQAMNTTKP